jgi:hydrogenase maturation protease
VKRILIAGIGNIFLGDDGFGCEVVRQLASTRLAAEVTVKDFGIRSYDLAYALVENFDLIILVDAAPRGDVPGTTYLIEIDPCGSAEAPVADAHVMTPVRVLQMAQSVGPVTARLYLVGCEPEILEIEDGQIGLSEPVRRAVPQALTMIAALLADELGAKMKNEKGQVVA